jgi:hypothetical protein
MSGSLMPRIPFFASWDTRDDLATGSPDWKKLTSTDWRAAAEQRLLELESHRMYSIFRERVFT